MKLRLKHLWTARTSTASKLLELFCTPLLVLLCLAARYRCKPIDIGLGPEPLINNIYHKKALELAGYTAETFVAGTYFITDDFDINLGKRRCELLPGIWRQLYLFINAVLTYKCLFIYMNGGPLFASNFLASLEPFLYKLSRTKIVVMPYGSDVQDIIRSPNLYFRHTICQDYPLQKLQYRRVRSSINRWSRHADWMMAGCEWVDYMYHWNTLQLAHFSIDTKHWSPNPTDQLSMQKDTPLKVLHAPNHKNIKGTASLTRAIEGLQMEGLAIELVLLQGVPNTQIREAMQEVDLVADQFVIGWYAMFAIEAMALEKPVLCYLRSDLLELYTKAGLIRPDEVPLVNTDLLDIKETLRWACQNRNELRERGRQGRAYVLKHHSIEKLGRDFNNILKTIAVLPCRSDLQPCYDEPLLTLTELER